MSALGNVVCFDTDFEEGPIAARSERGLGGRLLLWSGAESRTISLRDGASSAGIDITILPRASTWISSGNAPRLFEGRHDFIRFCKPEGKATMKTVDKVVGPAHRGHDHHRPLCQGVPAQHGAEDGGGHGRGGAGSGRIGRGLRSVGRQGGAASVWPKRKVWS